VPRKRVVVMGMSRIDIGIAVIFGA